MIRNVKLTILTILSVPSFYTTLVASNKVANDKKRPRSEEVVVNKRLSATKLKQDLTSKGTCLEDVFVKVDLTKQASLATIKEAHKISARATFSAQCVPGDSLARMRAVAKQIAADKKRARGNVAIKVEIRDQDNTVRFARFTAKYEKAFGACIRCELTTCGCSKS